MNKQKLRAMGARVGRKAKQVGALGALALIPAVSFAQTVTEGDVSDSTAKVALWLTGAITLSIAFTAAYMSVKASKLPRRGA